MKWPAARTAVPAALKLRSMASGSGSGSGAPRLLRSMLWLNGRSGSGSGSGNDMI